MKTRLMNKDIRSNYVKELLMERGLTKEEIEYFLEVPDASYLQNPAMLYNITSGFIDFQVMSNLSEDDRLIVVVDSDCDGFASAAIFIQYLRNFNEKVQIDYVLHEGKGHGLSDTIDVILEKQDKNPNIRWVILPDSSSNDYDYHERLGEENIRVLVLDHHIVEPDTKFSKYAVIINNQLSPDYDNKDLCGAGVVWQFCRWCDMMFNTNYADEYIDLAAFAEVSDMMSMLSLENRYIVHTGLNKINNYFLKALCEKQSYSMGGKITPITIAFYITPLVNAMIRTGSMEEKQRCFEAFIDGHKMVESHKRGAKGTFEELAIESARECTNARSKQNRILDKAVEQLEIKIHKYNLLENKILFIRLDDEDFPPELNGLVAMKLAAKYQRPTIVARLNDDGEIKGSLRGLNESELKSFKDFLDQSGFFTFTAGHANAAGCGILDKNLDNFHKYANKELAEIDFGESWYEVNFERIAADQDIKDLITDITACEDIYGQHNPEPLIHIKDINITDKDIRIMGRNSDTVKIEKFGIAYMKFHAKNFIEELKQYNGEIKLEVVGRANLNEWMGNYTPQIFISDYEISDGSLGF